MSGRDAQTTWSIIDAQGRVIEGPSRDRFSPALQFLRFFDDNDDGIFEPGSLITFPMFTWSNLGGLTCPGGSVLQVNAKTNATLLNTSQPVMLGPCAVSASQTIQTPGLGAQFTPYNPSQISEKPYLQNAHFTTDISMLGRSFFQGSVPITVPVQFPVRLVQLKHPDLLGPGERGKITMAVKNISLSPYGQPFMSGSLLGAVRKLFFHTDANSCSHTRIPTGTRGISFERLYCRRVTRECG